MNFISFTQINAVYQSHLARAGPHIVETAKKVEAQLVVMGTRGLGKVRRALQGSVSDYVVHNAHCPVMICRQ